jgi:hypothetical protein
VLNLPFEVEGDGAEDGEGDHVAVHGEQELVEAGVEGDAREHLQAGVAKLHDDERRVHDADAVRLGWHHAGRDQRLAALLPLQRRLRHHVPLRLRPHHCRSPQCNVTKPQITRLRFLHPNPRDPN